MAKLIAIVDTISPFMLLGEETRVKMQDLPEPVQKAVKAQTKTVKLRGLAKEVENGETFYEAEAVANGKSRDVLIDSKGNVVEVEEATTLGSVPGPVQSAIKAAAVGGKVVSIETVTTGSAITYEAAIQKAGKTSEVAFNADGSMKK